MKSNDPAPERILIIGIEGTGKSEAWVSTAAKYRSSDTPGTFYVLNTEPAGAIERMGVRWSDFASNVQWENVTDWQSLIAATQKFLGLAGSGDWIIIDSVDRPWEWVRDSYAQFWADHHNLKSKGMFDIIELPKDDKMWDRINGEYRKWILSILDAGRNPAHVLCTSPSQGIRVEGMYKDDAAIIEEFGRFGVRPAGQKHLSFQHHTVLLAREKQNSYVLSTMKDRSRERMQDAVVLPTDAGGFAMSYLYQIAQWTL